MRKSWKRRGRRRRRQRSRKLWHIVMWTTARATRATRPLQTWTWNFCKDPRTINHHLSREVVPGGDVRILTDHEEKTLVKYIINRNRAYHGLNDQQVAGVVLNILRVQQKCNQEKKKGVGNWNKHIPLCKCKAGSGHQKSITFLLKIRAARPEVKPKSQHKVSLKRGLCCTKEMAIEYLDELASSSLKLESHQN